MPSKPFGSGAHAQPYRILIVDDHEVSRAAFRALLRTQGLEIVADVAAAEQAIAVAQVVRPDVAIVDVTPGDDTGPRIARGLRALPNAPNVIVTSSADRSRFDSQLDDLRFVAKADIAKETILD